MNTETIESELIAFVIDECSRVDTDKLYDDMLDECYSLESVGGPFACMCASRVLKEVDPTAYRCGHNDWLDSEDLTEIQGGYYRNDDIDDARDKFVDELDNRGTDLETEIEEMEQDEDHNLQELAKLKRDLEELRDNLTKANKYTF